MKTVVAIPLCLMLFSGSVQAREAGPEMDAKVVNVVDGDTIKVKLMGRMPQYFRAQSVRLRHCDAPEMRDKRPAMAALAREAKEFVEDRVHPGMRLTLRDIGRDKYGGRILADITVGREDLCRALIRAGLALPYEGGRKEW
jgi:micrococcal nuclease